MKSVKLGGGLAVAAAVVLSGCGSGQGAVEPDPHPGDDVVTIPIVVHVVHNGEPVGRGANLSNDRIEGQIRILNEDFRRRPGSPGFNTHPDGGDARIQFALAELDPAGAPTSGIDRIDASSVENPVPPNRHFDHYAEFAYWDPERYVNVWTMPLPESARDIVLGMATGPETDLPGADLLLPGEPHQAEGILVNAEHFGPSGIDSHYNRGRTLTHEMGHYFGLLHLWGSGDCDANDFCADTPPVSSPITGCPAERGVACDGSPVMFENYMTYTRDACMNLFTREQVARMRHVLDHSPRRRSLPESTGLTRGERPGS